MKYYVAIDGVDGVEQYDSKAAIRAEAHEWAVKNRDGYYGYRTIKAGMKAWYKAVTILTKAECLANLAECAE